MAKALNKTRMRDSWLIGLVSLTIVFFTKFHIDYGSFQHELIEYVGYGLIIICAIGRIYSSAFLGGHKNKTIIDYGPFSVVRNPLYVFSLIGFTGISFLSLNYIVFIFMPLGFLILYYFLIQREEKFLEENFGDIYKDYKNRVPRFIPSFKNYTVPNQVVVNPKTLKNAAFDALGWFIPIFLFEIAEYIYRFWQ